MRKTGFLIVVVAVIGLVAAPAGAQNVLVFDDNSYDSVAAQACANLGYSCTVAGYGDFVSQLTGGTWHLVVMDMPSTTPDGDWQTPLAAYVNAGGRAILTGWEAGSFTSLATLFGVSLGSTHNALTQYQWNTHPLFSAPNAVPATLVPADDNWGDNGFLLTTVGDGVAAAGFLAAPTAGQASIVIGNGGRTIFNGFLFDDYYPADADSDGVNDIVELVENQMVLALQSSFTPAEPIPVLGPAGIALLALALAMVGLAVLGRRLLG
jgi:hypothetical protein